MQSSSDLFPVALISAELRGDLTEDVYRLKPNNSPDSSVELALTRLGVPASSDARGTPVILLHGSFSNRRFWFSPKGIGLGAYLARAGFDVWIAEMRGHGLSPRNLAYQQNRVADYARYDLPAIADFVAEQTGLTPHWLGHSLGGISLAAAVGGGYLDERRAATLALFGSQVSRGHWALKVPPVEWAARALLKRFGGVSGARSKRGPEDEPAGLLIESLRWHGLLGRFGEKGRDWLAGLAEARMPVLMVTAEGDLQDPPWACRALLERFAPERREFLCLGPQTGFSEAFGHVQMLVSKAAQQEVYPLVAHWLERQALPARQPSTVEVALS
ncbi:alpha/beta fold hydrolase [Pseudomonas sp.]|uniref:alpha/beta fold hydrolase n=1 Tax=Pseudomonas sp. TaxID=306 RepID=UPI0028B24F54|nr:alpha/beta fold hydrolase [Pseudomonas sp.]